MAIRNIVKIDEEKCTGCGRCATACAEGAIQIIDGKAKLISDSYCDGLGACLGHCPEDAISVEQREADEFDEAAVQKHLAVQKEAASAFACPGLAAHQFEPAARAGAVDREGGPNVPSELTHWPVQLKLISPTAQCFADADLLLAADCVPVAMADFHRRFLKERSVALGCPKLDDTAPYVDKLAEMLRVNDIRTLTVVHMEVPCCSGLTRLARQAVQRSGKNLVFEDVTVSIRGGVIHSEWMRVASPAEA
jgi:Pyruvate/2-oxoacid:ferredoxin oxidoreductase delta subunit